MGPPARFRFYAPGARQAAVDQAELLGTEVDQVAVALAEHGQRKGEVRSGDLLRPCEVDPAAPLGSEVGIADIGLTEREERRQLEPLGPARADARTVPWQPPGH